LAGPNGATSIDRYAHLAVWDERYAVVLDDRGFTVIDANDDRLVRLMLDADDAISWAFGDPVVHAGRVWIGARGRIVSIALAELEPLADHAGAATVALHPVYPLRRPDARLECVYLWKLQSGKHMVEIGNGRGGAKEPKLEIVLPDLSLAKYSPLTLCDELVPGRYARAEIPGHGTRTLATIATVTTLRGKITIAKAKDPTAVVKSKAVSLPTA